MTLEERITRLEDIEAIKLLKAKYCEACDDGHNAEKVLELFADDGVWDGGDSRRAEGKSAIKAIFDGIGSAVSFSQHNVMNPIIEVNGDTATGVWNLLELITFHESGETKLLAVRYDEKYVKIDGSWKYKLVTGESRLMSEVEVTQWNLPHQKTHLNEAVI